MNIASRLITDVVTEKPDVREAVVTLPDETDAPEPPDAVEKSGRGDRV